MTYTTFRHLCFDLDDCEDLDHYIGERGYQDWMIDYTPDAVVTDLTAIWGLKDNPIKGVKSACHITTKTLSERFCIPIRTVEDWSSGARSCPTYTWQMIAYISFTDFGVI